MKKKSVCSAIICTITIVSCHRNIIVETIDKTTIIETHETAIQYINELLCDGSDFISALNNCIDSIGQLPDVKTVYVQDDNIIIAYNSGVVSIIALIDENKEHGKKDVANKIYNYTKTSKNEGESDLITNRRVLIWDPFSDGLTSEEEQTGEHIQEAFSSSSFDFNVTLLKGKDCTLASLNNLTQYGFIYIKTHGGVWENSNGEKVCWIATGESYYSSEGQLSSQNEKIIVTFAEVSYDVGLEVSGIKTHGGCWGITNKFISNHVDGEFESPSIVFVQACHSYDNESLRNAFIEDKKASAYLGYRNGVTHSFGYTKATEFVENMLNNKMDSYNAYNSITKKQDNSIVGLLCNIHINGVFPVWWHLSFEPAELFFSTADNSNPTYFGSIGYVECPDLNERWVIGSSHYFPNPYAGTCQFSQLLFLGLEFQIVYRLSKMNEMEEGVYTPYIINSVESNNEWENNNQAYPMRFLVQEGNFSESNGSTFWHKPEIHFYRITGGQLKYQNKIKSKNTLLISQVVTVILTMENLLNVNDEFI